MKLIHSLILFFLFTLGFSQKYDPKTGKLIQEKQVEQRTGDTIEKVEYDPNTGELLLDGHDLREISFDSLSSCISMVPQEPVLFSETVNENIRYNRTGINDDKIVEAAKLVGADQFIKELSDGYKTKIAENGLSLIHI